MHYIQHLPLLKALSLSCMLLLAGVLAAGCDTMAPNSEAEEVQETFRHGQYVGRATTTITYRDAFGRQIGTQRYEARAEVNIDKPAQGGGLTERNPFHLTVHVDRAEAEGALSVWSALGFSYKRNNGEITETMVQYWDLSTSGNTLSGRLTDTHIAESLALNLLNAWNDIAPGLRMTWPYAMDTGTRLSGRIDGNTLTLRIEGNATSLDRPFVSEVVVTRQ